jgi:hypothetical protein
LVEFYRVPPQRLHQFLLRLQLRSTKTRSFVIAGVPLNP